MTSTFEASYGGSEANIALALANLGVDSTFFSAVSYTHLRSLSYSRTVCSYKIRKSSAIDSNSHAKYVVGADTCVRSWGVGDAAPYK